MIKYHPIDQAIAPYLENLDLKTLSIKNYKSILHNYAQYLKSRNIRYPKRSEVINYRTYIYDKGLTNTTIQKHMVVIKSFYRWARLNQSYHKLDECFINDISEGVKGARVEQIYRKEPLSIEQLNELYDVSRPKSGDIIELRNHAIILLMIVTGLRTVEVSRAKLKDISILEGKTPILYVQGKGRDGKDEFVKLPEIVLEAINEYKSKRTDKNKYLFTRHQKEADDKPLSRDFIGKMIKKLLLKAGIDSPKITPHSLRHTVAHLNLKYGGSIESTQQLLRHKNIETTMIYAHNIRRIEDLSEERIANILQEEHLKGEKN
ncbi:MAG: tyrosine-type recombinase/integrase [Candidatus Izemoplasmataceae bacterium]